MTDKLTIREGGYYRTRHGWKVGPIERGKERFNFWTCVFGGQKFGWFSDGSYWPKDHPLHNEAETKYDLIAEWKDDKMKQDDIEWGPWHKLEDFEKWPQGHIPEIYQTLHSEGNVLYRLPVKREPQVRTVTLYGESGRSWVNYRRLHDTHRVTLTLIDDVPVKFSDPEPLNEKT